MTTAGVLFFFSALGGRRCRLGLSTCACVLARGGADEKGDWVIRPYTPVSTNAMMGKFQPASVEF